VAVDVGQGDATVVLCASGKAMLIDGGRDKRAAQAVLAVLKQQGVSELNWVVATHYDSDHICGLDDILKNSAVQTDAVYDPGPETYHKTSGSGPYASYLRMLGDPHNTGKAGKRHTLKPGQRFDFGEGIKARCVVVNGDVDDGVTGGPYDTTLNLRSEKHSNARSAGLLVTSGEFEYLTCGDLTSDDRTKDPEIEYRLVQARALYNTSLTAPENRARDNSDIDVYHVNHHGSHTSSGEDFVRAIMPEVSLVSCGGKEAPNGTQYHHPHPDVLFLLGVVGSEIFVTGAGATRASDYSGPGNYVPPVSLHYNQGNIAIVVDDDGRGYWVRPQRGTARHFSSVDAQ